MSFGKNLQYLRQLSKNMTQEALAEKLKLKWKSKFQFAKVNACSVYPLQE